MDQTQEDSSWHTKCMSKMKQQRVSFLEYDFTALLISGKKNWILLLLFFSERREIEELSVSDWRLQRRKSCVIFSSLPVSLSLSRDCCWEKVKKKWWRRRFQSSIKSVSQTNRVTDNDFSFSFSQEILWKTRRGMFILHTTWIEREISLKMTLGIESRIFHHKKEVMIQRRGWDTTFCHSEFTWQSSIYYRHFLSFLGWGRSQGRRSQRRITENMIWFVGREGGGFLGDKEVGMKLTLVLRVKWRGWTKEGGRDQDFNEYETKILPKTNTLWVRGKESKSSLGELVL